MSDHEESEMIPEDEQEDETDETLEEARASWEEDLERDRAHDDQEWGV